MPTFEVFGECDRINSDVNVWIVPFKILRNNAGMSDTLSEDELIRADSIVPSQAAQDYRRGRGLLRNLLSAYVAYPPEDIQFIYGEHGKPYIEGGPAFNVSHTNSLLVIAIANEEFKGEIGVDIEQWITDVDNLKLAQTCFSKSERDQLNHYPTADSQRVAFTRGWSRKEAVIKAVGTGLKTPLADFDVSLEPIEHGKPVRSLLTESTIHALPANCCQLYDLGVRERSEISLAIYNRSKDKEDATDNYSVVVHDNSADQ